MLLYMSSRHFLFHTSSSILKTSCGNRETPAIRVRRSCTAFQNDLRKLPLWIREQQAFKLPLSTPEGGPAVFHCCIEQIYLYISFQAREKERKKTLPSEGVWQSTGVRGSFSFFIFIYSLSVKKMKWQAKAAVTGDVEFSLLENPIVQNPSAAAGRFFDSIYSGSFLTP